MATTHHVPSDVVAKSGFDTTPRPKSGHLGTIIIVVLVLGFIGAMAYNSYTKSQGSTYGDPLVVVTAVPYSDYVAPTTAAGSNANPGKITVPGSMTNTDEIFGQLMAKAYPGATITSLQTNISPPWHAQGGYFNVTQNGKTTKVDMQILKQNDEWVLSILATKPVS